MEIFVISVVLNPRTLIHRQIKNPLRKVQITTPINKIIKKNRLHPKLKLKMMRVL